MRETANAVTVELAYDATRDPFFALGLVPMPDPTIRRTATVRLGGL